ncbi:proton channel OTOP2-like [Acipenser oxyrinchus oxyrinchus]|uniref:Proton channel OTOP2-like n=1 Tax=Acipenser oxyrinchus oxyrinchus TaxID=40147 RepID=A0AAD8G610_ACIOX|nr:proton channel OTOP2-like [Acipenser oxyrinchus oxyrinchus]
MSQPVLDSPALSSYQPPGEHLKPRVLCSPDSSLSSCFKDSVSEAGGWQEGCSPKPASLLSVLHLILVSLLGSAILLSEMSHHLPHSPRVHGFLMVLMLASSAWMLCFGWQSRKTEKHRLNVDHHAGASWLKAGLALFALATLILDCFSFGYYREILHCTSPLMIAFPLVQAVFTVTQVSFLSSFAKVCIQDWCCLHRVGLMNSLATNLLLWMNVVLDESTKQLRSIYMEEQQDSAHNTTLSNSCACTTDLCHIFRDGAAHLHPFNIEFSLFSSTMLYVLWKNLGRVPSSLGPQARARRPAFRISGIFPGLLLGALVLSATFGCMIVFGVFFKAKDTLPHALQIYYTFSLILLCLMLLSSCAGTLVYRLQKRSSFTFRTKNVVRNLDVALLLGCSCGPLAICIFSMTAIFFTGSLSSLNSLDLFFSLFKTLQVLGQNLFISEALFSGPDERHPTAQFVLAGALNKSFDSESQCAVWSTMESSMQVQMDEDEKSRVLKMHDSPHMGAAAFQKPFLFTSRRRGRAKIMQNILVFLLLCNIAVWILYAYGARPHLVSETEQNFYGFTLWATVVTSCLPLGIFYHIHSAASLFEVYCKSQLN